MTELVKMLRRAHAIEIGAYNAYEGHWRSIKPITCEERGKIKWIQIDELLHRETIERMLKELGGKPSFFLDSILWVIGKSISIACYVMPYRAAMWGAKIMESMGSEIYENLILQAIFDDHGQYVKEFMEMAQKEKEHEKYFKSILESECNCFFCH